MKLQLLESGFWHARWSDEVWAQWPKGRPLLEDDFFHSSGTPERIRQAEAAANPPSMPTDETPPSQESPECRCISIETDDVTTFGCLIHGEPSHQ